MSGAWPSEQTQVPDPGSLIKQVVFGVTVDVADREVRVVDCIASEIVVSWPQAAVIVVAQVHTHNQKDQTKVAPVLPEVASDSPEQIEQHSAEDSEPSP